MLSRITFLLPLTLLVACSPVANSQTHQLYPSGMPPGVIGQGATVPPGPVRGYYQPVKVLLPEGCEVAFAENEQFPLTEKAPVHLGLLVGAVYRFQITQIPFNLGMELYPSVELINRTYPPQGKELEFPIEIELTQEDMEFALQGRFITRVIFLEDPFTAVPTKGEDKAVLMTETASGQNPLDVAVTMGRPMAIVRIGSRTFDGRQGSEPDFFFGSPIVLK